MFVELLEGFGMLVNDKISVIIPVFNLEDCIKRTLDSVCAQTYSNLEIIVIDDGSTDKSYQVICDYAKKGWKIILFPHTPADVETINKLLINIPDNIKRNAINTAPYSADSEKSVDDLINWYERCRLVVGMRFHSCIINIDLRIPVIALAGHRQLEALYEELELNEYCIKLDNEDFVKKLDRCISEINSEDNYQKLVDRYSDICKRMKCMAVKNKKDMYVFLERNGVINEQ